MAVDKIKAKARTQRYRAKNKRIDYVPGPGVMEVIMKHLNAGLNNCVSGVLDDLVTAGSNAITGNAVTQNSGK